MNFCFSSKNLKRVVYISVVFPAPDHHVMIVKLPNCTSTLIFLRLYLCAFLIFTMCVLGLCSNSTWTFLFPVIYSEVSEVWLIKSLYEPLNTNSQPKSPAHGPISTTQSDALINSSLCSTHYYCISHSLKSFYCFNNFNNLFFV
jgi:hypothetical protein